MELSQCWEQTFLSLQLRGTHEMLGLDVVLTRFPDKLLDPPIVMIHTIPITK